MDEPMEASTTVQTQTTSGHESGDVSAQKPKT